MGPHSRRAVLASIAGLGTVSGCQRFSSPPSQTPADGRTATDTRPPDGSTTAPRTRTDSPTDTPSGTPPDGTCDRGWHPSVRWSLATETRAFPPTAVDGTVYFGSQDHQLYAVDADDGTVVWQTEHAGGSWYVPPIVAGGVVTYVGSGTAAAYDADTGRERWSFEPSGNNARLARAFGDDGDTLYVGAANHPSPSIDVDEPYDRLHAFDRRSGDRRWQNTYTSSDDEYLEPQAVTVGGGLVVAPMGDNSGRLVAFDTGDGRERWRRSYDRSLGRPVVADGTVYQNFDADLVALDAVTGRTRWTASTGRTPAVGDGTVYVADEDRLRAHSASDGTVQWSTRLPGLGRSLARYSEVVYVSGRDGEYGRLSAFDASTGCRLGGFTVRSASPTVPAVADDAVYVGGLNGEARMWAVSAP